ncbi:hypothetical protein GGF41_004010 [Coemansia sp. RSA 2531]|nr:hypothetical protein GGF41_004010 [Coemansia sp. RSA 2531]
MLGGKAQWIVVAPAPGVYVALAQLLSEPRKQCPLSFVGAVSEPRCKVAALEKLDVQLRPLVAGLFGALFGLPRQKRRSRRCRGIGTITNLCAGVAATATSVATASPRKH